MSRLKLKVTEKTTEISRNLKFLLNHRLIGPCLFSMKDADMVVFIRSQSTSAYLYITVTCGRSVCSVHPRKLTRII